MPGAGALREIGTGVWALWRGCLGAPWPGAMHDPFGERRLARALTDYLWRPLPTVMALAALIGVIAGVLCASLLKRFHVEAEVIPSLAQVLVAQVAPLLVGVFAAGRVAVAVVARMGGMQLQGEIDALLLRGYEPVRYVLGPVVASLAIAGPVLTAAASLALLTGMGVVLGVDAVTPGARFAQLVVNSEMAGKALGGLARGSLFLLLAAAAGGAAGSAPIRTLEALERQTARAFNAGLLSTFTAAAVSALFR